jgi:hypothetical protein
MWPEDQDRIAPAIDAVAREMTEATPDDGFRARVLARIDEPRRSAWRSPWVLSPLAVAAIVVLAVALRPGRPVRRDASAPAAQSARGPAHNGNVSTGQPASTNRAETEPLAQSAPSVAASTAVPPDRGTARRNGTGAKETSLGPPPSSDVDELAPPSIEIDTIALDRLSRPEPLTLQPLDVPSIALAPIDDGDRQ